MTPGSKHVDCETNNSPPRRGTLGVAIAGPDTIAFEIDIKGSLPQILFVDRDKAKALAQQLIEWS